MKRLENLSCGVVIAFVTLLLVVLAATFLIFYSEGYIRPNVLDLRREANQQSQQYVETTRGRLFQLKRNYDELGTQILQLQDNEDNTEVVKGMIARQKSLLDEMEEEANSIPLEEVPNSIKDLLQKEGKLQ